MNLSKLHYYIRTGVAGITALFAVGLSMALQRLVSADSGFILTSVGLYVTSVFTTLIFICVWVCWEVAA